MAQVIHVEGGALTPREIAQICNMFGLRSEQRGPNTVALIREEKQQGIIPFYGHLRERSRVNNAIRQLSGIAHPHIDGPGNGGDAA